MTKSRQGRRVGGKDRLLDIAADQFASVRLDDLLTSKLSGTALAARAGVAPGTVYHHFPGGQPPGAEALTYAGAQRALDRAAANHEQCSSANGTLIDAIDQLRDNDPASMDKIAKSLVHDLLLFSPDAGPTGLVASAEVAFFLLCAAAPTDPVARKMAAEYCHPNMKSYQAATQRLLEVTDRVMADGVTVAEFAMITGALSDGLNWQRRYMLKDVSADLMWVAWARLFTASTMPAARTGEAHVASPATDPFAAFRLNRESTSVVRLDEDKRKRILDAAMTVFDGGGWDAVTVASVADLADVSQNTVRANTGGRPGLAALVWGRRHIPDLLATSNRTDLSPIERLRTFMTDLASICQSHTDREMTKDLLDGVFDYSFDHGPYVAGNVADPRHYAPLAQALAPALALLGENFRPGYADTKAELMETAALLVNQTLHLAMVRGGLPNSGLMRPTMVAHRIIDTTLRGMMRNPNE